MPYTEDKRIRDLYPQITLLLTDVLAMDRTGALEATKVTMQQIVNLVSPNTTKQFVYADVVAPDNALGIDGDLAFRVPLDGSALQMYQKISNVWASVFNLPLSQVNELDFDESDLIANGVGAYYLQWTNTKKPIYVETSVGGQLTGAWLDTTPTPNRLYGFLNNSAQDIKVKIG